MTLPFTSEQFFAVFAAYNDAVWPAQLFLLALAVLVLTLVAFPSAWSSKVISGVLAFFWMWLAFAYHLAFFASINPLAYGFAAISATGAWVFLWQGVVRDSLRFQFVLSARTAIGATLIVFALLVYPAWSMYLGHVYPAMPTFGLPCPTALFTVGLLTFSVSPLPRSAFIVPILWCLVGAQAAILLGVWQDSALLVAAIVGAVLIARSFISAAQSTQ